MKSIILAITIGLCPILSHGSGAPTDVLLDFNVMMRVNPGAYKYMIFSICNPANTSTVPFEYVERPQTIFHSEKRYDFDFIEVPLIERRRTGKVDVPKIKNCKTLRVVNILRAEMFLTTAVEIYREALLAKLDIRKISILLSFSNSSLLNIPLSQAISLDWNTYFNFLNIAVQDIFEPSAGTRIQNSNNPNQFVELYSTIKYPETDDRFLKYNIPLGLLRTSLVHEILKLPAEEPIRLKHYLFLLVAHFVTRADPLWNTLNDLAPEDFLYSALFDKQLEKLRSHKAYKLAIKLTKEQLLETYLAIYKLRLQDVLNRAERDGLQSGTVPHFGNIKSAEDAPVIRDTDVEDPAVIYQRQKLLITNLLRLLDTQTQQGTAFLKAATH